MKKKEKYNFKGRPDRACSTDELRPAMQYILIDGGFMIATDGHMLVEIPLDISDVMGDLSLLNGWMIHKNQYVEIIRYDSVQVSGPGELTCKKWAMGCSFTAVFKLSQEYRFPDYRAVLNFDPQPVSKIGVNAKLLPRLISCFEGIEDLIAFRMEFQKPSSAIHFRSTGEDNSFGLLMPYQLPY